MVTKGFIYSSYDNLFIPAITTCHNSHTKAQTWQSDLESSVRMRRSNLEKVNNIFETH